MSQRDINKGRARELFNQLTGNHHHSDWLLILIKCMAFLLARYIDEQ